MNALACLLACVLLITPPPAPVAAGTQAKAPPRITSVQMTSARSADFSVTNYTLKVRGRGFVAAYNPNLSSRLEYMICSVDPRRTPAQDVTWGPVERASIEVNGSSSTELRVPFGYATHNWSGPRREQRYLAFRVVNPDGSRSAWFEAYVEY